MAAKKKVRRRRVAALVAPAGVNWLSWLTAAAACGTLFVGIVSALVGAVWAVKSQFDSVQAVVAQVGTKVDVVGHKVDALESRVAKVEQRVDDLRHNEGSSRSKPPKI